MAKRLEEEGAQRVRDWLEVVNDETLAYEMAIATCKLSKAEGSPDAVLQKFREEMEKAKKKLSDMEKGHIWKEVLGMTIKQQKDIVAQLVAAETQIENGGVDATISDLQDKVTRNRATATRLAFGIKGPEK